MTRDSGRDYALKTTIQNHMAISAASHDE